MTWVTYLNSPPKPSSIRIIRTIPTIKQSKTQLEAMCPQNSRKNSTNASGTEQFTRVHSKKILVWNLIAPSNHPQNSIKAKLEQIAPRTAMIISTIPLNLLWKLKNKNPPTTTSCRFRCQNAITRRGIKLIRMAVKGRICKSRASIVSFNSQKENLNFIL